MSDPQAAKPVTWAEVVKPIAERFRLGAVMGLDVTHKPEGARALAELLTTMAERLDRAVAMHLAEPPNAD